jgi:hypothetical protein
MSEVGFGAGASQESIGEGTGRSAEFDTRAVALEEAFCARLHAWDRHVDGCATCLAGGMNLCEMGREIRETVVGAREEISANELSALTRAPSASSGLLMRAWLGWAAFIAPLTG